MGKLVRQKLTKKQVKIYEELTGFKTTGEVYIQRWDKRTQKKIDKLMDELYPPEKEQNQ